MWYNPEVYTVMPPTEIDILWAIYQHLVATTSLAFALLGIYLVVKFLLWFLPKYWQRGEA